MLAAAKRRESALKNRLKMVTKVSEQERPVTVKRILEMKKEGTKIAMLTSYDYTMAHIVDEAGVDMILIGDSASNVMAGHSTTIPITLDQMIYHASCVSRAVKHALVVQDMLGMNKGFKPKFLRQYADLYTSINNAVKSYVSDVRSGDFPNKDEQY